MAALHPALPPVTDAHRIEAFRRFAWADWNFDQAMADPLRGRLLEARAHQLRTQEWKGHKAASFFPAPTRLRVASTRPLFDAKRAAAGDFDD